MTAGHDLFQADSKTIFEHGFCPCMSYNPESRHRGFATFASGDSMAGMQNDIPIYTSLPTTFPSTFFHRTAELIGPNRAVEDIDPMSGLKVERVVAQGASQSAGRLATFINAIAPIRNPIDGFILQIYFGSGTALEVGDTLVDINKPVPGNAAQAAPGKKPLT